MFVNAGSRILRRRAGPYPSIPSSTFANLPQSPTVGQLAFVTDSNSVTWGGTVAGGSSSKVLAQWNGSNWTVVGK
jgi:hypothetical protein